MPFWKLLKKDVHLDTYDHNFGLVVPCKTGFYWETQTKGVMCHHVSIEGIFIPLPMPDRILRNIQAANYIYNSKKIEVGWRNLKTWLSEHQGFIFHEVDAPEGYPETQEGLMWIELEQWREPLRRGQELEGETVALYYPNCN